MSAWIVIMFAIVLVLNIYAIVKLNKYEKKRQAHAKPALSATVLYSLVFIAVWIFDLPVPSSVLLFSMSAILINCFFGHYKGWFDRSRVFDRYLHAFGAFSFALLTYCIIRGIADTGGSDIFLAIFVFTLGNTLGAVFELIEAAHDAKKDVKLQRGLKDTNMDMLFDFFGSVLAGLFAYIFIL